MMGGRTARAAESFEQFCTLISNLDVDRNSVTARTGGGKGPPKSKRSKDLV